MPDDLAEPVGLAQYDDEVHWGAVAGRGAVALLSAAFVLVGAAVFAMSRTCGSSGASLGVLLGLVGGALFYVPIGIVVAIITALVRGRPFGKTRTWWAILGYSAAFAVVCCLIGFNTPMSSTIGNCSI